MCRFYDAGIKLQQTGKGKRRVSGCFLAGLPVLVYQVGLRDPCNALDFCGVKGTVQPRVCDIPQKFRAFFPGQKLVVERNGGRFIREGKLPQLERDVRRSPVRDRIKGMVVNMGNRYPAVGKWIETFRIQ